MASNNPSSFRLPIRLPADVHPDLREALNNHDDAIYDLQAAIPELKSQINTTKTSIASATTINTTTAAETVVIGTTSSVGTVNNQSSVTAYSTQQSDYGAIIILSDTSAVAITLTTGTAITTPWFASIYNLGAGTVTLTPSTGMVNESASLSLTTGQWTFVYYDGTNFWAVVYDPSTGGAVTQIIAGTNVTISPTGGTGAVTVNATGASGSILSATATVSVSSGGGTTSQFVSIPGVANTTAFVAQLQAPGVAFTQGSSSGYVIAPTTVTMIYQTGGVDLIVTLTPPSGGSFTVSSCLFNIRAIL
jgi:hypothetical protein